MDKKKIVIAEDDEDILSVIKVGLEDYDIIGAIDGREALEKIKINKPELIILDVMMPVLNGVDLNIKLKEDEELRDIPVIVITGRPNMSGLFSPYGHNKIDGFLEKPFTLDVLEGEIQRVLKNGSTY